MTITNFADTCTGRSRTISVYESYEAALAAARGSAAVDNLKVDTRRRSSVGSDMIFADGVFSDVDGVALFGFRIMCEA
ncbi:hypothetical protein [Mycobacterium sp. MUNTM1]